MGEGCVTLEAVLAEAELEEYEALLKSRLKLRSAEQLRFVRDEDLAELGMAKPEVRRLWKVFHKRCPHGLVSKLRRRLGRATKDEGRSREGSSAPSEASVSSAASTAVHDVPQHLIRLDDVVLCKQLGAGEFGTVWQGVWTQPHSAARLQVAVKAISPDKMETNPLDFLHEAAIMHKLEHPHVVALHGVVLEPRSVMLVTEMAALRSLAECLREPTLQPSFPVLRLVDFAGQIAQGMAYLEEERLIHRDLAARNVLVFAPDLVKVSDFGLSRSLGAAEDYYRSNFSQSLRLPIAWLAPEAIAFLRFTHASDVFAFGVTLWEMFSYGLQPWAGLNGHEIMAAVDLPRGERLEIPDACPRELYEKLLLRCWSHDATERPTFRHLLRLLPELAPEQVRALGPCEDGVPDHLQHSQGQLITVLDKAPPTYPDGYYWKGVVESGRTGLFQPANTQAHLSADYPASQLLLALHGQHQIRLKPSPDGPAPKPASSIVSGLRSSFGKGPSKVSKAKAKDKTSVPPAPLISRPIGEVRHIGHVHQDGSTFGSVPEGVDQVSLHPHDNRLESTASETASLIHRGPSVSAGTGLPLEEEDDESVFGDEAPSAKPAWSQGMSLLDEVFSELDKGGLATSAQTSKSGSSTPKVEAAPQTRGGDAEDALRPVSFLEARMLKDVTEMAEKLSDKALRKVETKERARGEQREKLELKELQLALNLSRVPDSSADDSGPSSREEPSQPGGFSLKKKLAKSLKLRRSASTESSGSGDSQRKCFSDQLGRKTDLLRETGWSPSAEDAYKSLVHSGRPGEEGRESGRGGSRSSDPEDPKPPSPPKLAPPSDSESEPDAATEATPVEESPNPLRMLRSDAGGIARSFKAPASRRRPPGYEHCADGQARPPPVPPKPAAKPSPRGCRPAVAPKPSSAAVSSALQRAIAARPVPAGLDFDCASVDKSHLLDFVLAPLNGQQDAEKSETPRAPSKPPRLRSPQLDYASLHFQGSTALQGDSDQEPPLHL